MRAIRAAMAGTESVQGRLDDFVNAISKAMRVKVASIYLLRQGEDLELSATKGLKKSAVHITRMKPGEGLVGHVALTARPLNLADAPSHPLFSYRPETGEDAYSSFLGVPILRGGRTLGVRFRSGWSLEPGAQPQRPSRSRRRGARPGSSS